MNVGGQAVLEGVMMRGASNWAVAVRKPDGDIAEVHQPIKSPMARHLVFRLPVIRGVIALGESLAIGFRALSVSANYAVADATSFAKSWGSERINMCSRMRRSRESRLVFPPRRSATPRTLRPPSIIAW